MIGFLNLSTTDTSRWVTLYRAGGCLAHCRVLRSIPGFYQKMVVAAPWLWQSKMSPDIANCLSLGVREEQKHVDWEPGTHDNQENNEVSVFIWGRGSIKTTLFHLKQESLTQSVGEGHPGQRGDSHRGSGHSLAVTVPRPHHAHTP